MLILNTPQIADIWLKYACPKCGYVNIVDSVSAKYGLVIKCCCQRLLKISPTKIQTKVDKPRKQQQTKLKTEPPNIVQARSILHENGFSNVELNVYLKDPDLTFFSVEDIVRHILQKL